jgi:preprotein translocase subunit SecE
VEKFVRIAIVVCGILAWALMARFFNWGFHMINPLWDKALLGAKFTVSDALGILCGIATIVALWRNERVVTFGMEVANELRNVTWPTWPETRLSTIVVIAMTIVVSAILGLFDAIWGALLKNIYRI